MTTNGCIVRDTLVVGGGLGGLLAAASAAGRGRSVLVVERLPYLGGRFTTVEQEGYQITTGALHLAPYGAGGVLARSLASLGIGTRWVPRDVIASFWVEGKHLVWRNPTDILGLFRWRARLDLARIVLHLAFVRTSSPPIDLLGWLRARTTDPGVLRVFERFVEFALSIHAHEISYADTRAIFRSIARYGLPTAPSGGCKAVVDELADYIRRRGGEIRASTEVVELLDEPDSGRVVGARTRDRKSGREEVVYARVVISDAGPRSTAKLFKDRERERAILPAALPVARGLKLHLVSDRSLIPHNGIMFCLDTKRIAGIVQVSNAVPLLAPPGQHLLDTFQVLDSDDVAEERRLAEEDLRHVFGRDYDRHCRIVRASAFRGSWPVNRVVQGQDHLSQTPLPGLIMVGDAYKPTGQIMVEGVAGSVQNVFPG